MQIAGKGIENQIVNIGHLVKFGILDTSLKQGLKNEHFNYAILNDKQSQKAYEIQWYKQTIGLYHAKSFKLAKIHTFFKKKYI